MRYKPLSDMPRSTRDLTLILPPGTTVGVVEAVLQHEALVARELTTVYTSPTVAPERLDVVRNVTWQLTFQRHDREMSKKEVSGLVDSFVRKLKPLNILAVGG